MNGIPSRLALRTLVLGVFFCSGLLPSTVVGQKSTPQPSASATPESSPVATVAPSPGPNRQTSLTEIATGADELKRLLQEVKIRTADDPQRVTVNGVIQAFGNELESRSAQTAEVLSSLPTLPELQDLEMEWRAVARDIENLQKELLDEVNHLTPDLVWLRTQETKWQLIQAEIQADSSLAELHETVSYTLQDIQATRALAEDHLKKTVTRKARLSQYNQLVVSTLEQINQEKQQLFKSFFRADSSPLWQVSQRRTTDLNLQRILRKDYTRDSSRFREFLIEHRYAVGFAISIFILALLFALKARRRLPEWKKERIVSRRFAHVFERPFAIATLFGLLATFPLLPAAPAAARGLLSLLFVIPVLRLLSPLLTRIERRLLFALVICTFVVQFTRVGAASAFTKRDLLGLYALAFGVAGVFLARKLHTSHRARARPGAVFALRIGIVMMFSSFVANLFGFFGLSQVLLDSVLLGAYYAVVLYTAKGVILIILTTAFQTERGLRSYVIRDHRQQIVRWARTLLGAGVWIFWAISILSLFTIRDDFFDATRAALSIPIVTGENNFTGRDIINFILVVLIGVLVATIIRIVLRDDVLRRLPVRQGVPFAVSTITFYVLLFFIFLLALSAAGVQLSKFTIFTGAFGIGVGFGLQNTINNFASGVVLLVERPIRENDILEVDGAFGEVTRIGMRSTSIRTGEEAEVILPNSELVARKVINWSRLGKRRPVDLTVRVAYGNKPKDVIDLLLATANRHPQVLSDPPATAFLLRFGEIGMEFSLVFWVPKYQLHREVLSDVAVSVTEAFAKAGIEIPVVEQPELSKRDGNNRKVRV
jgi:potassium-dependent mechanosensitive channel